MKPPILCLDFDGVLHSYTSGWKGVAVVPDCPTHGALEFLARAVDMFEVHVYSSRSKSFSGRRAMQDWLSNHLKLHFGSLKGGAIFRAIKWPWFKPAAFVTIDDRALQFTGEWPALLDLLAFRTWTQKLREKNS